MLTVDLTRPHGFLLWRGKQTAIAGVKHLPVDSSILVTSDGEAFGHVKLGQPAEMTLAEFEREEWAEAHCIRPEERRLLWPDAHKFFVQDVKEANWFDRPKPFENGKVVSYRPDQKDLELIEQTKKLPKQIILKEDAVCLNGDKFSICQDIEDSRLCDILEAVYQDFDGKGDLPLYSLALVRNPRLKVEHDENEKQNSYEPPELVQKIARQALEWRKLYKRGATPTGWARGRDLANGRNVSEDIIKEMSAWFARHGVNRSEHFDLEKPKEGQDIVRDILTDKEGIPTTWRISWDLWGGDPGREWVESLLKEGQKTPYGEVSRESVAKETDSALLNMHRHVHGLAALGEVDCQELERVHSLLVAEMEHRQFDHSSELVCQSEKDYKPASEREKQFIDKSEKLPKTIILTHKAVSLTGSQLYGKHEPQDTDMVILGAEWRPTEDQFVVPLTPTFKLKLERALKAVYGIDNRVQYISEVSGASFDNLPLYSLALVRVPQFSVERVSDSEPDFAELCYDKKDFGDEKKRHSRSKCMLCDKAPEVDIQWADGRGRAWFCLPHFEKWVNEEDREIVRAWFVDSGEVPEKIGDNKRSLQVRVSGSGVGPDEMIERLKALKEKLSAKADSLCVCENCDYQIDCTNFRPNLRCPECGGKIVRKTGSGKALSQSALERKLRGASAKIRKEAKATYDEDKVIPGRMVLSLKPMRPAKSGQRQTVSHFYDYIEKTLSFPLYVSCKADGATHYVHGDGKGRIWFYSDDGKDNTDLLPHLVDTFKENFKGKSFVFGCEVTEWKDGNHYPREAAIGDVKKGADEDLVVNIFRVIYWDGEDLHKEPFEKAWKIAQGLPVDTKTDGRLYPRKNGQINLIPHYKAENITELKKLVEKLAYRPGAEGVVVKRADGGFSLSGEPDSSNPEEVKWHKSFAGVYLVTDKTETATKGVYTYTLAIGDLELGKTFGTSTDIPKGSAIELEGEQLNVERDEDDKIVKVSVWAPEVMSKSDSKPESLETIVNRAKEHGVLREKIRRSDGAIEYLPNDPGKPSTADKALSDKPHTGAMIALFPDIASAKDLVDALDLEDKANPDELHVTLTYLGEAEDLEDPLKVLGVLEGLALETEPLTAKVDGVGLFKQETEGKRPLYAAIDCPGLAALRSELVERLSKAGIGVATDHDFTPHMTLAYIEPGLDLSTFDVPEQEFEFADLVLGLAGEYQPVPLGLVSEKAIPMLDYPSEDKTYKFVYQHHYRGKSCHGDFRVESGDYLIGWTIADQQPGAIKEPVTTEAEAKKADANLDNWKLSPKTGEIKPRQIRGGTVRKGDLRAFPKATEIPEAWLTVEGVTDKPDPGEKPPVGATANYPGVFTILQNGTIEHGAKKPYVQEYFVHGKTWGNQRWLFRMLGRGQDEKQDTLPVGQQEENPRSATFWVLIQADPEPYVLSKSAIEKDWLPPKGISALPKAIRTKVPKELRYWETSGKEALDRRRKLAELDIREIGGTATKEVGPWQDYLLQRHWWRGQVVIRWGASTEHYDLRIELDGKHWHLVLDGDPLTHKQLVAYEETKESGGVTTVDGKKINVMKIGASAVELAPDQPANPTKDTPAFIQTVDSGKVRVIDEQPGLKKLEFKDGKLKGAWIFRLEDSDGTLGTFSESKGPETKKAFKYRVRRKSMGDDIAYVYACEICQKDFEVPEVLEEEPVCPECDSKAARGRYEYATDGQNFYLTLAGTHYKLASDVSKDSLYPMPTEDMEKVSSVPEGAKIVTKGRYSQPSKSEVDFIAPTSKGKWLRFETGNMHRWYWLTGDGRLTTVREQVQRELTDQEKPIEPLERIETTTVKPTSMIGEAWPESHQQGQISSAWSWTPQGGLVVKSEKAGRRLRGDKVGVIQSIKESLSSLVGDIQELLGWASYEDQDTELTLASLFKGDSGFAVKEVQGEPWIFTWSSNAFKDRQKEIFTTEGLEKWADRMLEREHKGFFNLWHIPGSDFAEKRWAGVPGRFLAEAGPFLKDEKGKAALKFFSKYPSGHPSIAPEGWGCSVEFKYLPEERKTGTMENFDFTRTSILPKFAAANLWTLAEVKTMALSDNQREAAVLLFGDELAGKIFQEGEQRTKELEEAGVAHKTISETPVTEEEGEKCLDAKFKSALNEISGMVEGDDATAKAIKDVAGKLAEGNMAESGRTLKMLSGKLSGDMKGRLAAIADALTGDGAYPAPGAAGGGGYPKPKSADTEPESGEKKASEEDEAPVSEKQEEVTMEQLAKAVADQFTVSLQPLAEGLASLAQSVKEVGDRVTRLEKGEVEQKSMTSVPRYVLSLQQSQAASKSEKTVVSEEDDLKEKKPTETQVPKGSMASAYFPNKK